MDFTPKLQETYELYFGFKPPNLDKPWTPNFSCNSCYTSLSCWRKGRGKGVSFGEPMVWMQQTGHATDCYFCLTDIKCDVIIIFHKQMIFPT